HLTSRVRRRRTGPRWAGRHTALYAPRPTLHAPRCVLEHDVRRPTPVHRLARVAGDVGRGAVVGCRSVIPGGSNERFIAPDSRCIDRQPTHAVFERAIDDRPLVRLATE